MKIKRMFLISLFVIAALAVIGLGPKAWLFTAGLRAPVRVPAPDYWPTNGWRASSPEAQGFDSARLAQGLRSLQDKQVAIDSLLIIRNGYIVLDAHFAPYDGNFPHDLASVTKSVMTTLIGIAVDQGKLDLDQPMVTFFSDRTIANLDERKASMTVRHLVSMRNGMQSGCYDGDEPTLEEMRAHPDWVQAALDRPMVAEPGKKFCYDSPGMHLLSAILQEATGMTAFDFAKQYLFGPLGIQNAIWESDPQGTSRGWGDLHLLPEDLAKIGFLWLQRGNWAGQQIVSEAWVLDSVRTHSKFIEPDFGYGYGWWITPGDFQAAGRGGQRARVIATRNTMVVVTGENADYAKIDPWLTPLLVGLKGPLPANLEGAAKLEAALAAISKESAAWKANVTSPTAAEISGNIYLCDSNPISLETVQIEFNSPEQATLNSKIGGKETVLRIGLDGSYRMSPEGSGARGYWEDEHTFLFDVFNIGVLHHKVVIAGDSLEVSLPEAGLAASCQAQ